MQESKLVAARHYVGEELKILKLDLWGSSVMMKMVDVNANERHSNEEAPATMNVSES